MCVVHAEWGPVTTNMIGLDLGCGWSYSLALPGGSFGKQLVLYAPEPLISFWYFFKDLF